MRNFGNPELVKLATEYRARLEKEKKQIPTGSWDWYPYDTLANFTHIHDLLESSKLRFAGLVGDEPAADIGCGDGDLSFFLAELGCEVDAIDNAATHHNGMSGLRAMQQTISANVQIHEMDLDAYWTLPRERYGLVCLFGVLYHLKNPIFVLEQLAKSCRYLLLSTRVAKHFPGVSQPLNSVPAAYLVGVDELNQDDSNYWIFTEEGLRRVLQRSHWRVAAMICKGDTKASDPVRAGHDERAFVLAESHFGLSHLDLLDGWHEAEGAGWRWTERQFGVRLATHGNKPKRVILRVFVPAELLRSSGKVELKASLAGSPIGVEKLKEEGAHTVVMKVPRDITADETLDLEVSVDPWLKEDRELGIIVAGIDMEW